MNDTDLIVSRVEMLALFNARERIQAERQQNDSQIKAHVELLLNERDELRRTVEASGRLLKASDEKIYRLREALTETLTWLESNSTRRDLPRIRAVLAS